MKETIGDRIKLKRNSLGITMEELGKELGISKVSIHKYESNIVTNIPSDKIEKIAQVLHTTPAYLMGWEEEPAPTKLEKLEDEFPEGVDVLRRGTEELSPAARKIMIKHMNQFIDDLAEMEKDED